MPNQIDYSPHFGLTIRRGPGFGYSDSFWGESLIGKDLPDSGARINFGVPQRTGKGFQLTVHFGYTSPTSKDYSRWISLDLAQSIEIIKYLSNSVNDYAIQVEQSLDSKEHSNTTDLNSK